MKKLLLIAAITLMPTMAFAQVKLPSESQILQTIIDDAAAALSDAQQHEDRIAASCWQAVGDVAKAKLAGTSSTGGKLMFAFQKVRDVTRLNQSPLGTQLIVGCAPLVQDAKLNMVSFFANIGGATLIKGLLIP